MVLNTTLLLYCINCHKIISVYMYICGIVGFFVLEHKCFAFSNRLINIKVGGKCIKMYDT